MTGTGAHRDRLPGSDGEARRHERPGTTGTLIAVETAGTPCLDHDVGSVGRNGVIIRACTTVGLFTDRRLRAEV